jgi:hypothetical protein
VMTLLEVRLREGNGGIWTVKRGQIKVGIYKITVSIKRVLDCALNIIELVIKIALYKAVVG